MATAFLNKHTDELARNGIDSTAELFGYFLVYRCCPDLFIDHFQKLGFEFSDIERSAITNQFQDMWHEISDYFPPTCIPPTRIPPLGTPVVTVTPPSMCRVVLDTVVGGARYITCADNFPPSYSVFAVDKSMSVPQALKKCGIKYFSLNSYPSNTTVKDILIECVKHGIKRPKYTCPTGLMTHITDDLVIFNEQNPCPFQQSILDELLAKITKKLYLVDDELDEFYEDGEHYNHTYPTVNNVTIHKMLTKNKT